MQNIQPPIVAVFAGNDPSGGAGLCADIQTLSLIGCHTAPILTCSTVQNTHNVQAILPMPAQHILQQAESIFQDLPIKAIKLGLLGSMGAVQAVMQIVQNYPHIPLIWDPILAAGGGHKLADEQLQMAMYNNILPQATIITPNTHELQALSESGKLTHDGYNWLLITGTHTTTEQVNNHLYQAGNLLQSWQFTRLKANYHGSGCTLAAAIAGYVAQGNDIPAAVQAAQNLTYNCLLRGYSVGSGQWLPKRFS